MTEYIYTTKQAKQLGFTAGRTCLRQAVSHSRSTIMIRSQEAAEGKNAGVINTDFTMAFDKGDRGATTRKMRTKGITGKLLRCVYNFLTDARDLQLTVRNPLPPLLKSLSPRVLYLLLDCFSHSHQTLTATHTTSKYHLLRMTPELVQPSRRLRTLKTCQHISTKSFNEPLERA